MTAGAHDPVARPLADVPQALWRWWRGEIAAMIPAAVKRWLIEPNGRLIVTIARDHVTVLEDLAGRRRRLGSFDLAGADPGAVRQLASSSAESAILELPSDAALRHVIALPVAAESNLAEVVSFELERHTPFLRAEAYHGFKTIGRDASRQRILVELTAAPRAVIDDALSRLAPLGLDIGVVRVAGEEAGAGPSPNLLPDRATPRAGQLPRFAIAFFAVTAGLLATAAIALPIVRAHLEAAHLEAALQTAKQQAAESQSLQKQIDAAARDRGFLAARKRRIVPVSALLDMVTRLLPDDTWLTDLRVSGSELQIAGLSASSSAVIGLLDGAPGLSNAGFRSPVTQDQLHREQFDIGVHLGAAAGQ